MAKHLNVNMSFTADTSKARAQLKELQGSLDKITSGTFSVGNNWSLNDDISEAISKATDLKIALESAVDVNTGNLNLKDFNDAIAKNKGSLADYAKSLQLLGPEGQKAFTQLSNQIVKAEVPLKKTNKLMDEFKTSLMNTARWQISSSILHGFMGALQSAYGYAQDLNESLNNIRIVTGNSVDDMAKFAVEANKAAKALSTTTTEYTNASLIYYQQGLSDKQVKERTDVTVKMANVSRQSAEVVSDQMTAVWNNFDDGSKSLEYYADVMTALGAATASSTEEIATGLEKFAAVSETVGLSYEYATAALATVTATTRQSADVVGTAFKTLFARIQDLELGETLEDGTTLGTYSEALEKVGINIKDTSGELKDMDVILQEMATKWDDLGKAEKTALAQSVAGVRQYTQLIALMDNWDFMEQNLDTVKNSSGALQDQADIYAESWEAASKRVQASMESIYDKLLDDEAFIDITNFVGKLIDLFGGLIDGLGGLKGVLPLIGSYMLKAFGPEISKSISNFTHNITMTQEKMQKMRETSMNELLDSVDTSLPGGDVLKNNLEKQITLSDTLAQKKWELEKAGRSLSETEEKRAKILMDQVAALGEQVLKYSQIQTEARDEINSDVKNVARKMISKDSENRATELQSHQTDLKRAAQSSTVRQASSKGVESVKSIVGGAKTKKDLEVARKAVEELRKSIDKYGEETGGATEQTKKYSEILAGLEAKLKKVEEQAKEVTDDTGKVIELEINTEEIQSEIEQIETNIEQVDFTIDAEVSEESKANISKTFEDLKTQDGVPEGASEGIEKIEAASEKCGDALAKQALATAGLETSSEKAKKKIEEMNGATIEASQGFMAYGQAITAAASLFQVFKTAGESLNEVLDGNKSIGSFLLETITALVPVIGALAMAFKKSNLQMMSSVASSIAAKLGFEGVAASLKKGAVASAEFGTSLWTALWPIGLVMAAIAALIVVVKELYEYFMADEIAAEKAAEKAKDLADATQEAKDKFSQLTSDVDEYKKLVEALENCTAGTDEWAESLNAVIQKTNELIEKYPELLAMEGAIFNDDGTLNVEALENYQKQMEQRVMTLQAAYNVAVAESKAANYEVEKNDFTKRKIDWNTLSYDYSDQQNYNQMIDNYEKLGASALSFSSIAEQLGYDINNLTEEQKSYIESLRDLGQEYANVKNSQKNAALLTVTTWAASEEGGKKDLSGEEAQILANNYLANIEQKTAEYEKKAKENEQWNAKDKSGLWEKWNELNGTNYKLDKNGIRGTDENRTFHFKNASGDSDEITQEQLIAEIAAAEALKDLGQSAIEAANFLKGISTGNDDLDEGLKNFIASGTFEGMSEEAFATMFGATPNASGSGGAYAIPTEDPEALKKILINNLLGDNATGDTTQDMNTIGKNLGYDITQEGWEDELIEKVKTAAENYNTALGTVTENFSNRAKELYAALDTSDYTEAEKKTVGSMLDRALEIGGMEGATLVSDTLKKLGENGDEFVSVMSELDWQNLDIEELADAMDEAGVDISRLTDEEMKAFIESLQKIGESTPDLKAMEEEFAATKELVEGIENVGDVISEEDYLKLDSEIGEKYFTRMLDGTYMLTEKAKEFKDVVEDIRYENFENSIIDQKAGSEKIKALSEKDYEKYYKTTATSAQQARDQIDYLEYEGTLSGDEASKLRVDLEDLVAVGGDLSAVYSEINTKMLESKDITKDMGEDAEKQYEEALKLLESYQLTYFMEQLPSGLDAEKVATAVEEFNNTFGDVTEAMGHIDEDGYLDQLKANIDNFAKGFADAGVALENANNLISGIDSGSITRDNIGSSEDYAALKDQLEILKETYPELSADVAILNNEWLVGTEAYRDSLTRVQDALYALEMTQMVDSAKETSDSIQQTVEDIEMLEEAYEEYEGEAQEGIAIAILAETDKFEQEMEKILEHEYEINVAIHAEMEQEFDEIVDQSRKMEQYAAKIGEDYIVAAEDIRELNQVFPGIIDNMKVLEDGSVQLNRVMVASAMNAAENEIKADSEATIKKLQNQISLLESKKQIYRNIAEACRALANEEVLTDEEAADTRAYISSQLGELEQINSQVVSDNEMLNMKEVADNSQQNAGVMATNYAEAAQSMAVSFQEWGNYALQVMQAVENKSAIPAPPSISPNYTGSGGVTQTATQAKDLKDAVENNTGDKDFYAAQAEKYDALIEMTDEQINDIEGMIGEINATSKEVNVGLNNVEKGKGIDPKEDDEDSGSEDEKERGDINYKYLDEEIERYHEINELLEDLNRNLSRISKEKDKAFGKAKLAMYDAEIAATEELIDAQKDYIKEARSNYFSDQAVLRGFGAQFDESGRISNYDEIMAKEVGIYNTMAALYDGYDEWDSAMESADKRYEDFQTAISNYEESLNTLEEKEDELKDYVDQVAELKLAKIQYEVEIKILLNDKELDYLEYLMDKIEDKTFSQAEQAVLLTQQADLYLENSKANAQGIEDILASKGASAAEIKAAQNGNTSGLMKYDFTEEEVNAIMDMMDSLLESNKNLLEVNKSMQELLPNLWKESNEKIDEYLERYEYLGALTESYLDIIDIVGRKAMNVTDTFVQGIQRMQVEINKSNIRAISDDLERLKKEQAVLLKQIQEATDEEWKNTYIQLYNENVERYKDMQQDLLSIVSDSLQTVMDVYTEKIESIFNYFEKKMLLGYESIEQFMDKFDKKTTLDSQYLPEYKKLYELSKLNRQINDSLDSTSSVKAKKELRKLQEQINSLQREGVEMSEYDLNYLQKQYDLELARLALEEAREAKTQVRLVKDSEGAYGYVYTADSSQVDDAAQKYEDALYSSQSLNEEYISDLQSDYMDTYAQMMQDLAGIKLEDYGSFDDYKNAVEDVYSFYQDRLNYYSSELGKVLENNSALYTSDYLTYDKALSMKELRGESFTLHFKETILGQMLGSYNTLAEYTDQLVGTIGSWDNNSTLLGELNQNWQNWHTAVNGVLEETGTSVEDFGTTVYNVMLGSGSDKVSKNVADIIWEGATTSGSALRDLIQFMGGDVTRSFTDLQVTVLDTMVNAGTDSALESLKKLAREAGITSKGANSDAALQLVCDAFGFTGSEAEKLKIAIKNQVGQTGNMNANTMLGAFTLLQKEGSRETSDLAKNIYGSVYSNDGSIVKSMYQAETSIGKLTTKAAADFSKMSTDVDKWENVWTREYAKAILANETLYFSYMKFVNELNEKHYYPTDTKTTQLITEHITVYKQQGYSKDTSSTGSTSYGNTGSGSISKSNTGNWSKDGISRLEAGYIGAVTGIVTNEAMEQITNEDRMTKVEAAWEGFKIGWSAAGYDTGGYTGDWNSDEGRMAVLHEKELVLNKSDTENMLGAISILRDLVNKIEINSLSAMTASLQSPNKIQSYGNGEGIQQNITIQADFPGVTDHNEIEEALNSLTLKASQYVNRY